VRIFHEAAVGKPLLDQALTLFRRQAGDVNVVDQRQVNLAFAADSSLGREFRNVVDPYFNQVSRFEPQRRT